MSMSGVSGAMSRFIRAGRLLAGPGTEVLRRAGAARAGNGLAAVALAAVAIGLAGCAGQPSVALPPKAGARPPARLADQPGPRQQVMAAYTGYWRAVDDALNAGSAARARQILTGYAPASALPGLIRAFRQDWARHVVTDGNPVLHIISVRVSSGQATVHDCVDLSHAGLQNARTGRVLPHSFGSPRANFYASLIRQGSQWLVSNIVPVVAACEP